MSRPQAKVTDMQQLADLAKVSRATVSRALSDSPLVNEKTKRRIQALAEKHGYVLNEAARNFRLKKTHIISVVHEADVLTAGHVYDPFFLEIFTSIAYALSERGFDTLLAHAPISNARELMRSRIYQQSDGLIFIGQGKLHSELNILGQAALPMMVWGAPLPRRQYRVVGADNEQGGYLSTMHLLEQGCRHVAYFGDRSLPEIEPRYRGYVKAHREAGLPLDSALELTVPFEANRAFEVISRFLDKSPQMDGVMCCSDMIAMSAISSLNNHGLRVPQDVAVVGYDDLSIAERASPPLTSISQQVTQGGQQLVEKLLDLMSGKKVSDGIAPAKLVIRESSLRSGPATRKSRENPDPAREPHFSE